ncbi:MAG: VOC family protein [Gammaproteobacteria bacterium]|nr:VOC family protein [Gammaproteobacteria bacterium]
MLKGVTGIHHLAISVPSLDEARAFYCGVLGFEVAEEFDFGPDEESERVTQVKGAAAEVLMLRAGNVHVEIFEYRNEGVSEQPDDRPVCDHGFTHFALEVDGDIDAVYDELENAGVKWHSPLVGSLDEEGYRVTYGRDPFGNVIEIQKLSTKNPGHISYLPHWKP